MTRALGLALLASCAGAGRPGGGGDDDDGDVLSIERFSDQTGPRGRYTVEVDVPAGVTSMQVTGESGMWVSMEELYDPDGNLVLYWEDWWTSPYSLTNAIYGFTKTTAFDWPIRQVDGTLEPGRWEMVWSVVDNDGYYLADEPVDVAVALKRDGDFAAARVGVQIAWADGVDSDPAVVAAVEEAVERWREVWAAYDLELDEYYVSTDIDPRLAFAYSSDPAVAAAANLKGDGDLQLIVGEQIRNDRFTYGVSASIPGTIEPTGSTFVVLSWLVHAGLDAQFDADEKRLMGETMAHEIGHYMGLYHPVESSYDYWDALDDTLDCARAGECEDALGTNLMFPYSICGGGSCVATDQLTDDQVGVLQRYVSAL